MIDIVMPFYNDSDENLRNIKNQYELKEKPNDRQAMGEERYRDWECLKYWFRAIEKNCKWVNKVFLILACESQIPKWLDTSNPKLRIVYHNEYIPKDLLPTFNAGTIELFIGNIKDLSDNYVYCNDDYYFLNPTNADMFFDENNTPIYQNGPEKLVKFGNDLLSESDGTFYKMLNNGMDLQLRIVGCKAKWYNIDHLPVSHKKNFEKKIIDENYEVFIKANISSKFRHKDNFTNHIYVCLYKDLEPYILANVYKNSKYVTVRKDTNFKLYEKCDMVCFNDTEQLSQKDFYKVKQNMIYFFEDIFPQKSSYEK